MSNYRNLEICQFNSEFEFSNLCRVMHAKNAIHDSFRKTLLFVSVNKFYQYF